MSTRPNALLLSLLGAALAAIPATSQDWPQWRGPHRDGVASAFKAPETWPEKLHPRWRLEVGTGHSSPVLAGGTVYLLSREGDEEVARAVALADGEVLWRRSYTAPYRMSSAATAHGKGPKSTPAVAEGRLHTLGIGGIVSAFEAATGALLWQQSFAERYPATSPLYGAAASPLVDGGRVIVHVGGHHDGALTALDAGTGEVRWTVAGDGPGYASPIAAELGGRRQVITQTDRHVVGVDAGDGTLLWQIPFTTPWDQNIVTPLVVGNRLIVAGLDQSTRAYQVVSAGDGLRPEEVWANPDVPMYMSSPVAAGGRLFGLSRQRSGRIFAVDALTGKTLWTSEGRAGDNAALVLAGDRLWVLNDGAELTVLDPKAASFAPLARFEVSTSATWAHPLLTDRGVVVKDETTLALLAFGPPPQATGATTGRR